MIETLLVLGVVWLTCGGLKRFAPTKHRNMSSEDFVRDMYKGIPMSPEIEAHIKAAREADKKYGKN